MLPIKLKILLQGSLLGLALALTLTLSGSTATAEDFIFTDALSGGLAGGSSSELYEISAARLPTAGPLTYQDLKVIEAEARELLERNKQFRQDISPHMGEENSFDELVRQFDSSGGFDADYEDVMTLEERIDRAEVELRRARDLYAYLAVYADAQRFRNDTDIDCSSEEDPVAGTVDWCNFPARMRESLREAAYIRMIFGQQFTADALGFRFGADIFGGEDFVRDEIRKLGMAVEQFRLARQTIAEGLEHYLGNGCFVYEYYTETEWALLSRAVDGLQRARHHIAVRTSYLADSEAGLPAALNDADKIYKAGSIDQYADMLLMANLATGQSQCANGTRPDNDLVAEMVANLLSSQQSAKEMGAGRNVFGFDVSFTPARRYLTDPESEDTGLLDQAKSSAQLAKMIQDDADSADREFDLKQTELMAALLGVKGDYDARLKILTSCSSNELDDDAFFDCVDSAASKLETCHPMEIINLPEDDEEVIIPIVKNGWAEEFNQCINALDVGGQLKEEWQNYFSASLEVARTQLALKNLSTRKTIEVERNATVTHEILTNGQAQAAMEFLATLLDSLSVEFSANPKVSYNPAQPAIAALRAKQTLRQATAEMNIENANSKEAVLNLLLDAVELQIDLEKAVHQANAQLTVFENLASGTSDLAIEARRARSYLVNSPANDPSFRLIRDSIRLQLADQLERAARISYLAAKRAEYEYAARLSASGFRTSDIYRARTATDILTFLDDLETITKNLVVKDSEINREVFTLSVKNHVLGYSDTDFRNWLADHVQTGSDGKPVLMFNMTTSPAENGVFSNVIAQGYELFWLHEVGGIGQPKPENRGFGINLVTSETGDLDYRRAVVTQSGLVHLKARSGCIFEYKLIHPAALLGLEWPAGQPSDITNATFRASVNDQNGTRTAAFLGRPVSATDWQVTLYAGAPEIGLPDMDLQKLEDIELIFDTTHATRFDSDPDPSECVRIDY